MAGAAMYNLGNTCYLNSVVQALFHIPKCRKFFQENLETHFGRCSGTVSHSKCVSCAVFLTYRDSRQFAVISPNRIFEKLKAICKTLTPYRQEDGHEFLR